MTFGHKKTETQICKSPYTKNLYQGTFLILGFLVLSMVVNINNAQAGFGDGSINSTIEINSNTTNGPNLDNGDSLGHAVVSIGDLDDDGVGDIADGALYSSSSGTTTGSIFIHFMNSDNSVKSTVEINGSTTNGPTLLANDRYGAAIAALGDLDDDGVEDIAVGSYFDDRGGTDRGAMHIHFMNSDGSVKSTVEINNNTANGPALTDRDYYGHSAAAIGDLDGDGNMDLAVGAPQDPGGTDRGAVHIHFMNSDGSVKSTVEINSGTTNGPSLANGDRYGRGVGSITDFDGDGNDELLVGAHKDSSDTGAVHIHFMNSDGSIKSTAEINGSTTNGPALVAGDSYGTSVDSLSDLDGDGVDEIISGAFFDADGGSNAGAFHISFMNSDGSVKSSIEIDDSTVNGPNIAAGDQYGTAVADIGDRDQNGVNDVAVGAFRDDAGGDNRGAVHIHFMQAVDGFVKTLGGVSDDVGQTIVQTSDGGYVIAGTTESYGAGSEDLYIAKFTGSGVLDTNFGVNGTRTVGTSPGDRTLQMIQTSDGGFAIAGRQWDGVNFNFYIVKLTSDGSLDSNFGANGTRTVGGSTLLDGATALVQTSDSGYAVAGRTYSFGSGVSDFYIVKLASDGSRDGSFGNSGRRTVGGADRDRANAIVQTSDGGYLVTGYTANYGSGGDDVYIVKLTGGGAIDTSFGTGGKGRIAIGGTGDENSSNMIQTSDGGYIMTGFTTSYGAGGEDIYAIKLTAAGVLDTSFGPGSDGTFVIGGTGDERGQSIFQTSDGGYVIGGSTTSYGAGGSDAYIIKITNSGLLDSDFGASGTLTVGGASDDDVQSIMQTSDGDYALVGTTDSFGSGGTDLYIIKMSSTGYMGSCDHVSGSGGAVSYGGIYNAVNGSTSYGGANGSGGSVGSGGILTQECSMSIEAPGVATNPMSAISATSATGNGSITNTGGEYPSRYIEWGIQTGIYTNSCFVGMGGIGDYSCNMSLVPDTTYYVRSKATNSVGTGYGSEVSFTTTSSIIHSDQEQIKVRGNAVLKGNVRFKN